MELSCSVQNYHWGKPADQSVVAELAASNDADKFKVDPDKKYAEFWMGTHPSGPSSLKATGKLLADYLKENPSSVGSEAGTNLPYLFKVLSVDTALSIQVHPCKAKAEELHKARPDLYKDDNHKPEMALAVTDFEGLCGFRPLADIKHNLRVKCPEISSLISPLDQSLIDADETNYGPALRDCFSKLLRAGKADIEAALDKVAKRMTSDSQDQDEKLLVRLMGQYPGDVGCLVMFFLNVVHLKPGEAMFLAANVPHAYLKGDCIECMSRSDNVIRAGLTPKLIDVEALIDNLDYRCVKDPADVMFEPSRENRHTLLYDPPVPDFAVAKITVDDSNGLMDMYSSNGSVELVARKTGSIVVVTRGSADYQFDGASGSMAKGTVLFVPASRVVSLENAKDLLAFQAFF